MTTKEFKAYMDTLDRAQQAMGIKRENKRHLVRLERMKELLMAIFAGQCVPVSMENECDIKEFEELVESEEKIRRIYSRGQPNAGSRCGGGGRGVPLPHLFGDGK